MTDRRGPKTTRRGFVLGSAAAAACRPAPVTQPAAAPTKAPAPPDPESEGITAQTLAEAERLVGVEYTDAERRTILETIDDELQRLALRRNHRLPNGLAPATTFDPRPHDWTPRTRSRFRPSEARPGPVPSDPETIAYAPVTALSHWIARKALTSTRLTEIYLERLQRLGPTLQCTVTVMAEQARAQAKAADTEIARGKRRGPLHGIPWGAKDLLDTAGVRTTWGATPYRDRVAERDATVVRRLADAGAVLIAKLTLGALAYGDQWFGGRTRNPWHLGEGSSGSSAGSAAATVAGLVGFSLGTETLGSIVSPSMRCGATGLRPTFGRVPRTGAMALCWSLDKVGPIARSAEDTVLILDAIRGPDPGDPSAIDEPLHYDARSPIKGLRVGYDPKWFDGEGANAVDRAALEAMRDLGVEMVPIELPELPYSALLTILVAEAAAAFEDLTLDGRDDELVWQSPQAWPNLFRQARFLSAVELVQAQRIRRQARDAVQTLFDGADVVFGPSFAGGMLTVTNFTGHPSLTLRAGFHRRPLQPAPEESAPAKPPSIEAPHGVTIWGRLFDEGTVVGLGRALERKLGVWSRRPPLS